MNEETQILNRGSQRDHMFICDMNECLDIQ